jgi:integrase
LRATSLKKEAFFLVRPKKQFGRVACERITAMHIQQLQAAIRNDGCKNTYNNLVLGATSRVLRFAKVWRRIRDDVTRLPEGDSKPVARVLELEEKKRLFEVAKSNPNWTTAYAAALIAASTTARGADLRGLRWSDIDLFEGVMTIPDSKTEAGKRRVPLNSDAIHGFRLLVDRATRLGIACRFGMPSRAPLLICIRRRWTSPNWRRRETSPLRLRATRRKLDDSVRRYGCYTSPIHWGVLDCGQILFDEARRCQ